MAEIIVGVALYNFLSAARHELLGGLDFDNDT